jgi:hypothetical protein
MAYKFRGMRIYRVHANGQLWKIIPNGFSFIDFETGDRRIARKVVRLARRLGYKLHF